MKKIFLWSCVLVAALTQSRVICAQEYVKILSYNIRNTKGLDGKHDCQRVANVILDADPDVVAVQELDSMTNRSGGKYVLGEIANRTRMHATYRAAIDFDGGRYGIGVLSREKPIDVRGIPLPGREERRAILITEFEKYIFACIHLSLTEEDRMASLEIIRSEAAKSTKPFYIAGDLNDTPGTIFMEEFQRDFKLLSDPREMTFPADNPDRTLDYIAVWKGSAPIYSIESHKVIDEPLASDHRPVMVELKLDTRP